MTFNVLHYAAIFPSLLAMFWLVIETKWYWNNRPDLQFGWIVVLLSLYLLWEAWPQRPALRLRWHPSLTLGAATAAALFFIFQIYRMAFGTTPAALYFLATGTLAIVGTNLGYVFGWPGIRHFIFPFAFILIAIPMPSVLYIPTVTFLQGEIARLNVELLNLLGVPAQRFGNVIHLPQGSVGVDEACSGIRSLQSTIMATLFIGHITLRYIGLRGLLLLLGVLLAIVGNLLRSLALSLAANSQGPEAVNKFHDTAGWSILIFTALGVALLAALLARSEKSMFKSGIFRPRERTDSLN